LVQVFAMAGKVEKKIAKWRDKARDFAAAQSPVLEQLTTQNGRSVLHFVVWNALLEVVLVSRGEL
jgi:hypothetical protein